MTTTLVDLAAENYGPQYRCRCGLVVRLVEGSWLDGSGSSWCWALNTNHDGKEVGR